MTEPAPGIVTKAEYARMRRVSDAYVSKLGRQGRLVLSADGRVMVEATDALIASRRDPTRGGRRAAGQAGTPGEALAPEWRSRASDAPAEAPAQPAGPLAMPPPTAGRAPSPAAQGSKAPQAGQGGDLGEVSEPIGSLSYADAQRLHKVEQVRRERLSIAKESGALVDAGAVTRLAFDRARAAQAALLAIPDRLAAELAAQTDPDRVHEILVAEIRRVCDALAGPAAAPAPAAEVAA